MNRQIIINADDFGLCRGVNKAIVQAYTDGVLTSATIMANMPAAREAVYLAKKLPGLGVGVHLNIFEGYPLSDDTCVKCLLDADGRFCMSAAKLSLLSITRGKIRNAIKAEFAAQIQWVINNGLKSTHLDSHKHIHSFPVIFSIVCELAAQFGISAVRFTYEPGKICRTPWPCPGKGGKKRAWLIRHMARINRLQNSSLLKTELILGIAHTGKMDVDFFKAVTLYNYAEIVEVITHPGYTDGLDVNKTRLIEQRKLELDALCSDKTKQYFKAAEIELIHYGQL